MTDRLRQRMTHSLWAVLLLLAAGCGEDRSGEYYALIGTQSWIYETMQQEYLFYEDLPAITDRKTYFKKPDEFLRGLLSSKDQKNGTYFSHVDSVAGTASLQLARSSAYPSFGFEGTLIRRSNGDYAIHVLYVQPDSPASQAALKRGDWIIAANQRKLSSTGYEQYIGRPAEAYAFTLGQPNGEGFDTLATVQMPAPTYVRQQNILTRQLLSVDGQKVAYYVYNGFGEDDAAQWKNEFQTLAAEGVGHIILDLRYNTGGLVSAAQTLGSLLAPAGAVGQPFVKMTYNALLNQTEVIPLTDEGIHLDYGNLYILSSQNTASASELLINCLRPYLQGRLFQVGEPTFGKNVAQKLFTSTDCPGIELWLTTCYLSNAEDFGDYFSDGLPPDHAASEDLREELTEFGNASDPLLGPVLTHLRTGTFPTDTLPDAEQTAARMAAQGRTVVYHPIGKRPKKAIYAPEYTISRHAPMKRQP